MLAGCATAPAVTAPPPQPGADPSVLMERDRAFDLAAAERGIDGFMQFVDDSVTILPPNEELQRGREAIRAHWADALADKGSVRWKPVEAHIAASGDLGYTIGLYEIHRLVDGQKFDRYGKYLTVWHRGPDGAWKVVSDLGTPSPAPQPAAGPAPAPAKESVVHPK